MTSTGRWEKLKDIKAQLRRCSSMLNSSCWALEAKCMRSFFFVFAMTETDRVVPCCQHGYVDEPCWQEGFFPREAKRQRGSRWSIHADLFSFVVEVFTMAPVFPASLVLISRLSNGLDRLVDATLRHIKWCRTSMIPARAPELNFGKSNSRSMLSIISD
jgi:hypothetical protein